MVVPFLSNLSMRETVLENLVRFLLQGLSRLAIFVCMSFELRSEGLAISLCFSAASSLSTSGESYALH